MVQVFKTSVDTKKKAEKIKPHLDRLLCHSKWNFDLNDCDHILRINSSENIARLVITELNKLQFDCIELD